MRISPLRPADTALLHGTFLFAGAPVQAAQRTLTDPQAECLSFEGGEVLYQPGDRERFAGVLLSGRARLRFFHGRRSVNILRAGQFFGMTSLFAPQGSFPGTVCAVGRCRVLFLPRSVMDCLFTEHPCILANYLTFLSGRILSLNRRLQGVSSDAGTRLAEYLLELLPPQSDTLTLPYGMTTLSAALGLGRATLYRAMAELEDRALLRREGRKIYVPSAQALHIYIQEKGD